MVSAAADAFLGFEILYNCPAVGWIEGEVVKRKVNRRMKIICGSDIVYFFVSFLHLQVLNLTNYNKDGSPDSGDPIFVVVGQIPMRTVVRIGKMYGIGFHSVRVRWISFVKFQILFVINY